MKSTTMRALWLDSQGQAEVDRPRRPMELSRPQDRHQGAWHAQQLADTDTGWTLGGHSFASLPTLDVHWIQHRLEVPARAVRLLRPSARMTESASIRFGKPTHLPGEWGSPGFDGDEDERPLTFALAP